MLNLPPMDHQLSRSLRCLQRHHLSSFILGLHSYPILLLNNCFITCKLLISLPPLIVPPNPYVVPSINITSVINQTLVKSKDFLDWNTQFTSHLMSHGLFGFVDGTISSPSPITYDSSGISALNPYFYYWMCANQQIRSWLFATIYQDILVEVRDLLHSYQICDWLIQRSMTASMAWCLEL